MNKYPGTWAIIAAFAVGITAISFSSIFIKWSEAPVSVIVMYRLLITAILMLPFSFKYKSEFVGLSVRQWMLLVFSGAALGFHFLFWMDSLRYTSVASSTVLLTLEPVFVMLGAFIIFKEKTPAGTLIGMFIAVTGAMMISWGDMKLSDAALYGDLLSLLGTVAVAVHMLRGQRLRESVSSFVYSFTVFIAAVFVFAVYNLYAGYSFIHYNMSDWVIFLLLAIVPTVLGHMLFNWLLKYVNATSVSMSVLGEPIGATLLAFWLLGEGVHPFQLLAGIIMLAGAWLFILSRRHSM
jgi:drug/metabolite transporter (DMT)-like permease